MRRQNEGILQRLERPALHWLATRIPNWMTPDMLTTVGFLGAVITFIGYAAAPTHPLMLLLASLGLIVNWFGDSLDGTIARFRGVERPTYGFFVDHTTDVFEQVIIALGMALSGYIRFELAILGLIVYLLLSVLTFAKAQYFNRLEISYSGFGPTEIRLALILMNIAIVIFPPQPVLLLGVEVTYPDLLSMMWSTIGSGVLAFQIVITLDELKAANGEQ